MMKELRRKTILKGLAADLGCFLVAAVALWSSHFAIFTWLRGPEPLSGIAADELEGRYVETTLDCVLDEFASLEETNNGKTTTTHKSYIIPNGPLDDASFWMGLTVGTGKMVDADELVNATLLYVNNQSDEIDAEPLAVRGTVEVPEGNELSYYQQGMEYYLGTSDGIPALVLRDGEVNGQTMGDMWLMTGIALVMAALGVYNIVKPLTGTYQKDIRRWCVAHGEPYTAMEELDEFYRTTTPEHGVRLDGERLMLQNGRYTRLLAPGELAWVYQSTVQHRTNGIPTGKTHSLTLFTADGKKYDIPMRKPAFAQELRDRLFGLAPQAVFGFDEERQRLFLQDRAAFAAFAAAQHAPEAPAPTPADEPAEPAVSTAEL